LNISRLAPTKGNAVLIHAIAQLRDNGTDVEVTIIGDGERRSDLERLAKKLRVDDRVSFLGSMAADRVREHYAEADVFCLPSFAEGVPVVLMEAMAMELPVIATRVMGVVELVEHGGSGFLVPPGRSDALADALLTLAGDPQMRTDLGRAGRQAVIARFGIHASAAQLHDCFSAVLTPPQPNVSRRP
jgi:glycosyltransferase involved in cell wall biosynthesis